jgi:hypothetical protein
LFSVTRLCSLQVAKVIVVTLVEERLIVVKKIQNQLAKMPKSACNNSSSMQ